MPTPAVLLLSGGLDSTTALAIAMAEGYRVHALSFRYGQRHEPELELARRLSEKHGLRHSVVEIDLRQFGGSALTSDLEVPKDRDLSANPNEIPITYVPARNTIFLSYALALAEVIGAADIFLGINAVDYSGYPDCRPEFVEAFERVANLATRAGVEGRTLKIRAPLIDLSKADIIRRGLALGVDYAATSTCYDPSPAGPACGRCDACVLRLKAFAEVGIPDPAAYQERVA